MTAAAAASIFCFAYAPVALSQRQPALGFPAAQTLVLKTHGHAARCSSLRANASTRGVMSFGDPSSRRGKPTTMARHAVFLGGETRNLRGHHVHGVAIDAARAHDGKRARQGARRVTDGHANPPSPTSTPTTRPTPYNSRTSSRCAGLLASIGLRTLVGIRLPTLGRRGARIARREEGACRVHVTDEQRSEAGCIGGQEWQLYSDQDPQRRSAAGARGRPRQPAVGPCR